MDFFRLIFTTRHMALWLILLPLLISCEWQPIEFPSVVYPDPHVERPPATGFRFFVGDFYGFNHTGYQTKEFFFTGEAFSFVNSAPLQSDGQWQVIQAERANYRTRMVVFRPIDPADFNGTVLVEWLNVSGGSDAPADWVTLNREIVRRGYAWVGVSAQRLGVEGGKSPLPTPLGTLPLKLIEPGRYCSLSHPGDSFSYDIFSQAARAVRYPVDLSPLGDDLPIQRLIAVGESQSAYRLITYLNAFGKSADLFDGYYIHSRVCNLSGFPGGSAPLSEAPLQEILTPSVLMVREDLGKPVMNLQTETDLFVLGAYANRQADNDNLRVWEVAGTSHADVNISGLIRTWLPGELYITRKPILFYPACPEPVNSAPQHHFVAKAALAALNRWIVDGIAPPSAPRLAVNDTGNGFEYDAFGNVLGGVRSPYVDVPIARLSGENSSVRNDCELCFIHGETELFDDATLQLLYPDHAAYVTAVTDAAQDAVANGFLLPEDAQIIIDVAQASSIPRL
jgi:hypothetical protein